MNEFEFIARQLRPLATQPEALGLADDAAVLKVPQGQELVITKDALVEGVHFIGDEAPVLIAQKALRVNLSDCAAMGAKPYGYFLALMLSEALDEHWLQEFTEGLARDQQYYGLSLLGGDTTRTFGSFALSITLLGLVPEGTALCRKGAKPGDGVYVTGTIGDAALGLACAKRALMDDRQTPADSFLLERYQKPEPRVELGQKLRGLATACIDISDGLVQDLGHICAASGVGAVVEWDTIPLSKAARNSDALDKNLILAGGDDYELLFTLPEDKAGQLDALQASATVTRIGKIVEGKTVRVLQDQKDITPETAGYKHF